MRQRIYDAYAPGEVRLRFYELAARLWPDRASWRYQSNGGPPGCAMALSAALSRYKIHNGYDGHVRWVYRPAPDTEER